MPDFLGVNPTLPLTSCVNVDKLFILMFPHLSFLICKIGIIIVPVSFVKLLIRLTNINLIPDIYTFSYVSHDLLSPRNIYQTIGGSIYAWGKYIMCNSIKFLQLLKV